VVLLQNGIHAGENGGKDASMMLLRDILVTKSRATLLDHAIVLSIAVSTPTATSAFLPITVLTRTAPQRWAFESPPSAST